LEAWNIQVLRDVGVLEVGAEAEGKGKAMPPHAAKAGAKAKAKGKAMPPPAATAGANAKGKGKAMPPPAAKAGAKAEAKAKAKAKAKGKANTWTIRLPEPEAQRRWVHIHWPVWPLHGRAFFVHRDSFVGELLPEIAKCYELNVSEFGICRDKSDRRLNKDTRWKDCGDRDIEVTVVKNGTVYIYIYLYGRTGWSISELAATPLQFNANHGAKPKASA